jgi:hypothetical protein
MASAIPLDLRASIERRTGAVIAAERARGGGGASRQGAEVVLHYTDGAERKAYLAWDARAGDPQRLPFFERETAVLAALSGPFADSGVKVAPLLASEPAHLALCSLFVEGKDRFPEARDKPALARDFVAQLARLHALDAAHPAFSVLGDAAEPPSAVIRQRLGQLSADNLAGGIDPIYQLALQWLADNVPDDRGPAVVLHGDAGPGNFLYQGDKDTALVDWELTHLGDPMEDLAQIWVRSLIQPFVAMREVFAAYQAASGRPVDVARVKYHRLYFQLGFSVKGGAAPATGVAMLYGTMHRRIIVESLAELTGAQLSAPDLPDCPAQWTDAGFAVALADLRDEIVPGLASERAAAKAKALARMVKFWRMRDRYGTAFDAQELAEIDALLSGSHDDALTARAAFGRAIAEDAVPFDEALQACHNRAVRETFLMADAMGALATTRYEDAG